MNTLYYGDNLDILREYIPAGSIDLVYLDPPFNSNRNYNVLFRDERGVDSEAQITAFEDTWHWGPDAQRTYEELVTTAAPRVSHTIGSLREIAGETSQMMAYLVMMAARLVELHRVLKPTGSLYLHCDPTASHYLKVILDTIFGPVFFRNEIIWKRTASRSDSHKWNHLHDSILFYTKSSNYTWHSQYLAYEQSYTDKYYRYVEPATGRRYASDNLTAPETRSGSSGDTWRGFDVRSKGIHWKYTIERLEELDREGRIIWPEKGVGFPRYKRYLTNGASSRCGNRILFRLINRSF